MAKKMARKKRFEKTNPICRNQHCASPGRAGPTAVGEFEKTNPIYRNTIAINDFWQ
jgi:hypothetical protein